MIFSGAHRVRVAAGTMEGLAEKYGKPLSAFPTEQMENREKGTIFPTTAEKGGKKPLEAGKKSPKPLAKEGKTSYHKVSNPLLKKR